METYRGYVINTKEDTEKGIFFRSPIQRVLYDAYRDDPQFSAWDYMEKIKNSRFKFFQKLIGNGKILKAIENDPNYCYWGGFHANILCSPIYFKRDFRYLEAVSENCGSTVQMITAYGYENEFEDCAGSCQVEKTEIVLYNGNTIKETKLKSYHYTYPHIIKKIIDNVYSL